MKNWVLLLLLFGLVACGREVKKPPPEDVVVEKSVPYQCGEPPAVEPLKLRAVTWTVLTTPNGRKAFVLSPALYAALMANMVDAQSVARQVKAQRDFYRDCIDRSAATKAPDPPPPKPAPTP